MARPLDPARLNATPTRYTAPPSRARIQKLPFSQLQWENFESVCWRLALEECGNQCRPYGTQGQDQQGIDILGRRTGEKKDTVYQCKRVKQFSAADILAAVRK